MKIWITRDDGSTFEVTPAVQIIYDALTASMDYGSGFLDLEELLAIHGLAQAAGFEAPDELLERIEQERRNEEERSRLREQAAKLEVRRVARPKPDVTFYRKLVADTQQAMERAVDEGPRHG